MIKRLTQQAVHILLAFCIGTFSLLHAVTAEDIQGEWVIDADATWEGMKMSSMFAAMPEEQKKAMEPMLKAQLKLMGCTVTADKIISTGGPQTQSESYKVIGIEGDIVKTESTNAEGVTEKTDVKVSGDKLILSYPGQEGKMLVLKRKPKDAEQDKPKEQEEPKEQGK